MTQAAAASIYGSKSVANSDSQASATGETSLVRKSNTVESGSNSGLQKRPGKGTQSRDSELGGASVTDHFDITPRNPEMEVEGFVDGQIIGDHYDSTAVIEDCGWIVRNTSLLVDEDHTDSCPLICGLATKADFPSIMYCCPHCHTLNRPKNMEKATSVFSLSNESPWEKDIWGDAAYGDSVTQDKDVAPRSSTNCVVETEDNSIKEKS